jgi:orotidine-5'-phosphate decarboxylase
MTTQTPTTEPPGTRGTEQDGEAVAGADPGADPAGDAERWRHALALALDTDDLATAVEWAGRLRPWFGVMKVGLQLYSACGPDVVRALVDDGHPVFLDLKLHDIPTTVGKAAHVVGRLGATYVTAHIAGGAEMLAEAVSGFEDGSAGGSTEGSFAGGPPGSLEAVQPRAAGVLGVTVLTSLPLAPAELLAERARAAVEARCAGVVCAARDLVVVRAEIADLAAVIPGVRPEGAPTDDQARAATPSEALALGADLLVVGRAVTRAAVPEHAAAALVGGIARAGKRASGTS